MHNGPDLIGVAFFTLCTVCMLCLTRWPRLWIALSVNRRWAIEEFPRKCRALLILTRLGAVLCACATAAMYFRV